MGKMSSSSCRIVTLLSGFPFAKLRLQRDRDILFDQNKKGVAGLFQQRLLMKTPSPGRLLQWADNLGRGGNPQDPDEGATLRYVLVEGLYMERSHRDELPVASCG